MQLPFSNISSHAIQLFNVSPTETSWTWYFLRYHQSHYLVVVIECGWWSDPSSCPQIDHLQLCSTIIRLRIKLQVIVSIRNATDGFYSQIPLNSASGHKPTAHPPPPPPPSIPPIHNYTTIISITPLLSGQSKQSLSIWITTTPPLTVLNC